MALAMFSQHMAVSKLAKELLFDGYDDAILDVAKSLPTSTTGGAPPVDKFGLFYEVRIMFDETVGTYRSITHFFPPDTLISIRIFPQMIFPTMFFSCSLYSQ